MPPQRLEFTHRLTVHPITVIYDSLWSWSHLHPVMPHRTPIGEILT